MRTLLSKYHMAFVVLLAMVAVAFGLYFRVYDRKVRAQQSAVRTDREVRRHSSLTTNTDIDSEEALRHPVPVNRDVLRMPEAR